MSTEAVAASTASLKSIVRNGGDSRRLEFAAGVEEMSSA